MSLPEDVTGVNSMKSPNSDAVVAGITAASSVDVAPATNTLSSLLKVRKITEFVLVTSPTKKQKSTTPCASSKENDNNKDNISNNDVIC